MPPPDLRERQAFLAGSACALAFGLLSGALRSRTVGSGPRNLVLIHGWGTHSGMWDPLCKEIGDEYTCHLVELPGHGGAPMVVPYDTDTLVAALEGALPDCTDGLVGWSAGGLLGMTLALRRPDLDFPLVLLSAMPTLSACGNTVFSTMKGFVYSILHGVCEDAAMAFRALVRGRRPTAGRLLAKARLMLTRSACTPSGMLKALRWINTHDATGQLCGLKRRTLVVHGTADTVIPPEFGLLLARRIPDARLELFEGASHTAFLDEPERFAALLREFLDG